LFSEFEELDKSGAVTVFKSYLKLQKTIKSSVIRSAIKQSFVEQAVFKGTYLASLMKELKDGLAKVADGKIDVKSLDIELIMETIAAITIEED
jgi:hypothetical protein